ncbi:LxmA leader domain family RiPP [Nocardioides zeae]|uniref:LxmA leader domain family RiPP n=1 Tax=Nocardioides imazamoxiresistens TaxID=3231893 RepID=A0ABU3PV48_9ACTN|nr:LxmA leader domain family RiPP [Nocardioides zeae]MDT9593109.1 LxmA leader domain family RiPP [Nocardioides zeae]
MSTKDLIAGYAAYTDAAELGHADDAAAITPTTTATTSSSFCVATSAAVISASVDNTFDHGC